MDALPPSHSQDPAPSAYVYAATEYRPVGPRETELCESASHMDYLYMGGLVLSFAASLYLDSNYIQYSPYPGVRLIGPSLIGLTWGATLGGGYLAIPKCGADFVRAPPPEGDFRLRWPLAVALGVLAGVTAPLIVAYETGVSPAPGGGVPVEWPVWERSSRVFLSGVGGFVGALLPYALPPKTWRAAKELEHIRAGADRTGASISYTLRF